MLTLGDSLDKFIRKAGIETLTSIYWTATESVNNLTHKDIVVVTAVRRQGTGATRTTMKPIRQKREASANSVRGREHIRTCKVSKDHGNGRAGSRDCL